MTHPTMTAGMASPVLPGDWVADPAACTLAFAVRNFAVRTVTGQIPLTSAVVHVGLDGEAVSLRAELDARGRRATGLIARFGSLPFRQLAGPAGLFFLWPPKSEARTSTSPWRQP